MCDMTGGTATSGGMMGGMMMAFGWIGMVLSIAIGLLLVVLLAVLIVRLIRRDPVQVVSAPVSPASPPRAE